MTAIATRLLKPQTGMVLLLCLILLTALTLLGLSATADTILQNQLSANLQETERAKQSAQATLEWAENWLLGQDGPAPQPWTPAAEGLHLHTPGDLPPHPEFKSFSWWSNQGHEAGIEPYTGKRTAIISGGSDNPPSWIIEAVHSIPPGRNSTGYLQVWYRILARGSGPGDAVISVVESVLVRSWPPADDHESSREEFSNTCPGSGASKKCGRVSWRELR